MSQQHKDILTIIERHGPISTREICEKLSELGYGGAMSWQDFRGSISKQLCYLRDKGDIAGEDRPQAKGKPLLRVWTMENVEEMASDMAEVESANSGYLEDMHGPIATNKESLTVADADMVAILDSLDTKREIQERQAVAETLTPEPVSVEVKVEHRPHLAIGDIMDAYHQEVAEDTDQNFYSFCLGIAYAEKHHGISQ